MLMRRRIGQLAAIVLFTICIYYVPGVRAQSSPDPHWLLEYKGNYKEAKRDLKWDQRFKPFIDHYLRMKQRIVPNSPNMGDVVFTYLGIPGEYRSDGNRYFYADGCMPRACPEKGLIWVDLKADSPTVVFAALAELSGSDAPGITLYVFTSGEMRSSDLPDNLKSSINYWMSKPLADGTFETYGKISRAVIVGPDSREQSVDPTTLGVPPEALQKAVH
jgi:hypothetical protein